MPGYLDDVGEHFCCLYEAGLPPMRQMINGGGGRGFSPKKACRAKSRSYYRDSQLAGDSLMGEGVRHGAQIIAFRLQKPPGFAVTVVSARRVSRFMHALFISLPVIEE